MENGIYKDIDIDEYHTNHGHYSASGLKRAARSLKEFKYYIDGKFENERKKHFDFGNAFELALLDKVGFEKDVVIETDIFNEIMTENGNCQKPRATTKYKEWLEKNADKYIVPATGEQSFITIQEMMTSCYEDAVINKLIKNIEYQYSIFWTDKETGLKLKTRPDICKSKKNIIVDVKTTLDGSPEQFSRDLANYDYPFQACMQIDGVIQSGFMPQVDNYFWLVIEKKAPFCATIYEFDKEDIKFCMDNYRYILGLVKLAKEQNKYPGYSQKADNQYGILTANIPLWYRNKEAGL